ncbi:MAG: hypothetical protein FJ271_01710 [Planctomycetes bacterium]|nr:hypothetical protein [Planctomycetota bacterium]
MSRLLDFYRGDGTDSVGRSLEQILSWDDDEFESVHDFIQWLFPLPEPSQFNPDAPLLDEGEIAVFRSDPLIRSNLLRSFERMLSFLGLGLAEDGKVTEAANFSCPYGEPRSALAVPRRCRAGAARVGFGRSGLGSGWGWRGGSRSRSGRGGLGLGGLPAVGE